MKRESIPEGPPPERLIEALDWLEQAAALIEATDPGQPIIRINQAFTRLTGYPAHEVLGRDLSFLQGRFLEQQPQPGQRIRKAISGGERLRLVLRNERRDGTAFWSELSLCPVADHGGGCIGMLRDVSELLGEGSAGGQPAGLPTRRYFLELLERRWREAMRDIKPLTIYLMELDGFLSFSEGFDPETSSRLLARLAQRLGNQFRRASDTVAHTEAGRFAAISLGLTPAQAMHVAQNAANAIRELDLGTGEQPVRFTLSTGMSTGIPTPLTELSTVLGEAEEALREARQAGGDMLRMHEY